VGVLSLLALTPPELCPPAAPPHSEKRQLSEQLHGREKVLEGLGRDLSRGLNNVKRLTQELGLEAKVGCNGAGLRVCQFRD
jgi:hypothetical protein